MGQLNSPPISRVFTSRKETRAFYDKISDVYDLLSEQSEAPMRAEGLKLLAPKPGDVLLEIGCGTGHSLVDLAGAGGRVFAVDLSERMLRRARALAANRGVAHRVDTICGDGMLLPLQTSSIDGIFMSFTLELFDTSEIPAVLAECARVLKPNGRIAVVGMSKEGPGGFAVDMYEWSHRHFPNFVDCRPIFVSLALQEAGFQVAEKHSRQQMWLPVEIVVATNIAPRYNL